MSDNANSGEAEVRDLISRWVDAITRKDVDAVLACVDENTVAFSLAPPLRSSGSNRAEMQAWFDTWQGPIEHTSRDLTVAVADDIAFSYGLTRMRGTTQAGASVELWFRHTLGLRRGREGWRIVHEHASVPFHMDGSFRAAIDLTP